MSDISLLRSALIGFCLHLLASGASAEAPIAPIARIDAGSLIGHSIDGGVVYRGVPFAAPPIGDLRWRDPQSVQPWTGDRDATSFAPACPQTGVSMPGEPPSATSEDCLYLNVWAPAGALARDLPVIVWFPGGGFTNGSTSIPLYDGRALAMRGVIVVTAAYRIGALGYLAHPALSNESPDGTSGNYGLMDQIAALTWVRRNITAFGGDPSRVTIAGQSAGATSVSMLMASPRAAGLFQRAIGQSGGLFEPVELAPRFLLANAEIEGAAWAAALGATTPEELRALPLDRLLAGADGIVHPVIEPRALPRPPYDAFLTGHFNDVPLLVGFNAEEARSLIDVSRVTAANFSDSLTVRWGPLPSQLLEGYRFQTDQEAREAQLRFERDLRFGWDVFTWARLQASHGRSPVFAYNFSRSLPATEGSEREDWGASHFAELWYMFDYISQERWDWTTQDRALASTMADYWTEFARKGDPNHERAPAWPAFTDEAFGFQILDETISHGVLPDSQGLSAFDAVYGAIRRPPA